MRVQILVIIAASWLSVVSSRSVTFWVEPYANLTSVDAYKQAWRQFGTDPNSQSFIMAGSAYAAKNNGSLGYANTKAGEGEHGYMMEQFGFPALKQLGLKTIAMVYVTHYAAIKAISAKPEAFIQQLVSKAKAVGIDGFDIDYEPQEDLPKEQQHAMNAMFMQFMSKLGSAMEKNQLILTIDIGDCPTFNDFDCATGLSITGLVQVNTMGSFGTKSIPDFQHSISQNSKALMQKWAPGFEPNNCGPTLFPKVIQYMLSANVSRMATWQVHECNVGDQPQWLFDAVGMFINGS
jgi:hypothetical protein